jgi:hypothetical protein
LSVSSAEAKGARIPADATAAEIKARRIARFVLDERAIRRRSLMSGCIV